jgi:hypothetical protein
MSKYLVKATEIVYYEKIVEADDERQAYDLFVEDVDYGDIADTAGFNLTAIIELED